MIIGIDLDNTILNYDYSFRKHAVLKKLIAPNEKNIKKEKIKNKIEKYSKRSTRNLYKGLRAAIQEF